MEGVELLWLQHYIVYMGEQIHSSSDSVISANYGMLASVLGSIDEAHAAVVHHYTKSFRGFSAMLTPAQAKAIAAEESVISVFESKTHPLHTTHSWDFLGVNSYNQYNQLPGDAKSDAIVGVIDSGVWPESKSFGDTGLGPIPKRFKGECVTGENFTSANCNRKIIGARFYYRGFEADIGPLEFVDGIFFRSARDADGHGSHTASTVAGSVVSNVSLLGMARGIARGGAPSARLAIYKACWFGLCSDADLLSAFEDATDDGVDIISISVGSPPTRSSFFSDAISIGSFHAFMKGVLVSASAGNSGLPGTASNVAPWILTVGASSIDREFNSNLYLGNSRVLKGFSLNPLKMENYSQIISASAAAAPGVPAANASFCRNNTLNKSLIEGKIVVCTLETIQDNRLKKSIVVKEGGGVGMIIIDPLAKEVGFQFVIPATLIGQAEAVELREYLTTEKNPVAKIIPTTTVVNTKPAPRMAVFSSMGPNILTPDIIKVSTEEPAGRSLDFNIISGTSMSCPHVSAIAALIKSYHPYWSPSAIKSAIMTTATELDNTGSTIVKDPFGSPTTPFDYGSGHINPVAALDPGLVYDFDSNDVIDFLCSNGVGSGELRNLKGERLACKKDPTTSYNLNYPSIGVSNVNGSVSVVRTVTYYGKGPTVYVANVEKPVGVNVTVTPYKLKFYNAGEKQSFKVDFLPYKASNGSFVFGSITWSNGVNRVRSPIGLNVISV
ncbi:hypothetical protein Scep_015265 [Stephania cephalantha]|uniref:Subtilisin-like protease SBT5.3 n=1 Tax=Stephania cephalantha TaxID=152367 RepID=A0AAP0J2V0_9MAGN